ncbi:helix-turn-helix domain-containing protein [Geodermatophilus sp. URMC 62]|uniref:helix-turn-helix domain-containing protein n=1 Tax=Geodermatophilus sp. URMC 62 TaxID=3423414 RepID=UPI00406C947A
METGEQVTGPSERVARNVRELRELRRLTVRDLAARLREIDHQPLSHPSAVSKVENGDRRVNADDLVALAVALDVSPNRLLLDGGASESEPVQLTPAVVVPQADAWRWVTGEQQLPQREPKSFEDLVAEGDFIRTNRPHDPPSALTTNQLREHIEAGHLAALREGYTAARDAGLTHSDARDYLDLLRTFDDLATWGERQRTRTEREDG